MSDRVDNNTFDDVAPPFMSDISMHIDLERLLDGLEKYLPGLTRKQRKQAIKCRSALRAFFYELSPDLNACIREGSDSFTIPGEMMAWYVRSSATVHLPMALRMKMIHVCDNFYLAMAGREACGDDPWARAKHISDLIDAREAWEKENHNFY